MKAFIALLFLTACTHVPPPRPVDGVATCADACHRADDLSCPWAKPTPKGMTCEAVCNEGISSGLFTFNLECRAKAPSCTAAEVCD